MKIRMHNVVIHYADKKLCNGHPLYSKQACSLLIKFIAYEKKHHYIAHNLKSCCFIIAAQNIVTNIMKNLTCRAKSIDGSTRKVISLLLPQTVLIKM